MNLPKALFVIWCLLFSHYYFSSEAYAASVTLTNLSSDKISSTDQEVEVSVKLTIDVATGTNYYLRGVFYQDGTHNYCGFTWNGSEWYSGPYTVNEGWKKFLPVSIASSSAETDLKAKLDQQDSGCKQSGTYKFKVERFTSSGSGSFDSQNELTYLIDIPTISPAPSASPTVKPSAVVKSSATVKPLPTNTPGKSSASSTPVSVATNTPAVKISAGQTAISSTISQAVLGITADAVTPSIIASVTLFHPQLLSTKHTAAVLIGISGLLFIISGGIIYLKSKEKK